MRVYLQKDYFEGSGCVGETPGIVPNPVELLLSLDQKGGKERSVART